MPEEMTYSGRIDHENTGWLGRNGWGVARGIEAYRYTTDMPTDDSVPTERVQDCIELTPLRTNGDGGRCHIRIPVRAIPELCAMLARLIL
jgi:hypothetical protein